MNKTTQHRIIDNRQDYQKDTYNRLYNMLSSGKPYEVFKADSGEDTKIVYSPISQKYMCRLTSHDGKVFKTVQRNFERDVQTHNTPNFSNHSKHQAKQIFQDGMKEFSLPQRSGAKKEFYISLRA